MQPLVAKQISVPMRSVMMVFERPWVWLLTIAGVVGYIALATYFDRTYVELRPSGKFVLLLNGPFTHEIGPAYLCLGYAAAQFFRHQDIGPTVPCLGCFFRAKQREAADHPRFRVALTFSGPNVLREAHLFRAIDSTRLVATVMPQVFRRLQARLRGHSPLDSSPSIPPISVFPK